MFYSILVFTGLVYYYISEIQEPVNKAIFSQNAQPLAYLYSVNRKSFYFRKLFSLYWVSTFILMFLIYLFLAVLGLCCCTGFSLTVASEQERLSSWATWASHGSGVSCCAARALGTRASVAAARGPSSCSSWALEHRVGSCSTLA